MSVREDTLTKIASFDRALLSLLGLIVILSLAAVLNAPFLWGGAAGVIYVAGLQAYGRLPRPRDLPGPSLSAKQKGAGLFDQRVIADSLSEAVWIINTHEQIIYANDRATTLFDQTLSGRSLATVLREPAVTQLVKTVLQGGTAEPVDYHTSMPVDRHLRVTATPIKVERGHDTLGNKEDGKQRGSPRRFAMVVFYDVTDFVKFAMTQGDFLANASHELKTPIASLLGYIETLRGHAKNDAKARERFLVIMQEQAERMQRLISDLLSLRQIEQSEHIAPSTPADILVAANFAIDTVSPLAKARGVKVSIEASKPMLVKGNPDELVQLCVNLIDNAVKMTPRGGALTISLSEIKQWRAQDFISADKKQYVSSRHIITPSASSAPTSTGYAIIRFTDSGPGFAPEHIPRLGERFYRIAGDRSSKDKGTGLGLAIVKHIILRHRGGLLVSSARKPDTDNLETEGLNSGTVFTVILPLHSEEALGNSL